jgi:dolichol-phosphate mannosyltransferase
MKDTVSLIIPTYDESENILSLLDKVSEVFLENNYDGEIIVVDDDSPDGTWKLVERFQEQGKGEIKLLRRLEKRGLSSAVLDGFSMAKGTILGAMDADLSHPPGKIPALLNLLMKGKADVVIGSRYTSGGSIENWPLKRRVMSKAVAGFLSPFVKVRDPLSGFFFISREVIDGAPLNPIGFKILLEILAKGKYRKVIEVPITFRDRRFGSSKLTYLQIKDFLLQLILILFSRNFRMFGGDGLKIS